MKSLHIPFGFYPGPVGGTEVYVESLAQHLQQLGDEVVIAAPAEQDAAYRHGTLPVRRYAASPVATDPEQIYGFGSPDAAQSFARVLDDEQPDIVHLHALTRHVSVLLIREAKRRDITTVFTYHTPTVSCPRGTLLRWGHTVCDGRLNIQRCAACALHKQGVNKGAALVSSRVPARVGQWIGAQGLSGGAWTALRMTALLSLRFEALRALLDEVDHIVVLCQWTKALLTRNNVPQAKITHSPHGLVDVPDTPGPPMPKALSADSPLRIVYLGRLDPTKGVDVLIKAARAIPTAPIKLDLFGIVHIGQEHYKQRLADLTAGDPRIRFHNPVSYEEIIPLLKRYHVLAVPSQWLETGPLVVLEAFAAKIPVIGSDLGGIAELISHETDGILVPPNPLEGWTRAIQRLLDEPSLLSSLQSGITPPRSMHDVALDMQRVYSGAVG